MLKANWGIFRLKNATINSNIQRKQIFVRIISNQIFGIFGIFVSALIMIIINQANSMSVKLAAK